MNENTKTENYDYFDEFIDDIQRVERVQMLEKADNVVAGCVTAATVTGAVPIPFADAPLLIGAQVTMMIAINSIL